VKDFPGFDNAGFCLLWLGLQNLQGARWWHPVERLIAAAIGVNEDTAIFLHHDDAGGEGEVSTESTRVINRTGCNDEPHGLSV